MANDEIKSKCCGARVSNYDESTDSHHSTLCTSCGKPTDAGTTPKGCCEKCYGRQGTLAGGGIYCNNAACPCHTPKEAFARMDDGLALEVIDYIDEIRSKESTHENRCEACLDTIRHALSRSYAAGYAAGQREAVEKGKEVLHDYYDSIVGDIKMADESNGVAQSIALLESINPQSHE